MLFWERCGQEVEVTLKLTTHEEPESVTLRIEGRVVGPWVAELDRAWRSLAGSVGSKQLRIDLRGVIHMSADGRRILAEIYKQTGAGFLADDPMTKYFAEEARRRGGMTAGRNSKMRGPYGLEMTEHCESCKLRQSNFFCQMTAKAVKNFDSLRSSSAYPEGAILFLEKQHPPGVFVLCEGAVKLTINSVEGKTLILRIAKAGEILGLMAALAGQPYEVSAETLRPCQIAFVRRDKFLRFLAEQPEVYQQIAKQLSINYERACEQLRTVGLSTSASAKLARLLLEWDAQAERSHEAGIVLPLTHEEIGEFIGSSRETVTRTLSEFKSRHLVTLKGSRLTIENHAALEDFAIV